MARDYYEVLGVGRNATKDDIKRAFRNLAKQYHPDANKAADAEAKFKEINEAYEILYDDEKRARYDRFGHAGVTGNAGASGFNGAGFSGFGGFEEIFEEFLNNAGFRTSNNSRNRKGPKQGSDRRVNVTINFEEAVFGTERDIEFDRFEVCETCAGTGAEAGHNPITCPQCNGTGEYRQVQQGFLGSMVRVTACPRCGGKGTIVEKPCRVCDGSGRIKKRATLNVKIPAGVHSGIQIQHAGQGDVGDLGAPRGNLLVAVDVKDHEIFVRHDNDILLDLNLNVVQATLGSRIRIPTVDGEVDLDVPAGTPHGKIFRLRGRGFPRLRTDGSNSGRGDQLVRVQIEIPTKLTPEQRQLFEKLASTMGANVASPQGNKGMFSRVMNWLSGE